MKKKQESKKQESKKQGIRRRWFLVPCLAVLLVQISGILNPVDWWIQDNTYQKGELLRPDIFVIGIDEETMQQYGSWQNWSRTGTAELLKVLNRDPELAPAVIGLDIGFFGESGTEADALLAEAAGLADNVVTTSYASFGKEITEDENGNFYTDETVMTYEIPYDGLKENVAYGFSNVPVDEDGFVRHSLYRIRTEGGEAYSFAAEIYRKYTGALPECIENGDESGYIPFAGMPYDYYGSETAGLSFAAVVNGEIPSELFAGAIVLVGPYTAGMMDSYYTAVSHDVPMYGVEVHANILQAFLDGNVKSEVTGAGSLALTVLMMILVLACLQVKRVRLSALLTAVLLAGYWMAAGWLYQEGYVLPLLFPLSSGVIFYVFHIGFRYVSERRAKRRIEKIFGRYVSGDVAASLVKGGEEALKLGGQKKDVAVLFVDIRGFTPLSESLPPEKVVEILNRYLELTTTAVFANKGTVDKFIGDATMALFNAPLDLDDYVFRAVKAGLDMAAAAKDLEKELETVTDKKVGFGIGINCGEAVIGNIGTSVRMDYTAIGNTVNVAARLEGQAKAGEVVISSQVYERLKGRILTESLGMRSLKGIAGETEVYRVLGVAEEADQ